jgi:hypothetical protein
VAGPDDAEIEDDPRRFHVELFVIHPTIDPSDISDTLGLEACNAHRVGDQRVTPKGNRLSGTYPDTRWRHSVRYEVRRQHFAREIQGFVNRLIPHKEFLHHLRATGGRTCLNLQFGDGYFGDEIMRDTMAQMVDLKLDFSIECFNIPQAEVQKPSDKSF